MALLTGDWRGGREVELDRGLAELGPIAGVQRSNVNIHHIAQIATIDTTHDKRIDNTGENMGKVFVKA